MEPAKSIIRAFGGAGAVAAIVGISRSRVYGWASPRCSGSGGTNGNIPHWHIQTLLDHAREYGIAVTAADFAPVDHGAPQRKQA